PFSLTSRAATGSLEIVIRHLPGISVFLRACIFVCLCRPLPLVRPCCKSVPGRAGVQGRADTLQVRPCKLAVFIPENRRSAQPCTPSPPTHSEPLEEKPPATPKFLPLRWDAPDTTV